MNLKEFRTHMLLLGWKEVICDSAELVWKKDTKSLWWGLHTQTGFREDAPAKPYTRSFSDLLGLAEDDFL